MSEQNPGANRPANSGGNNNNNRRHHNQRRRPPGPNQGNLQGQQGQQGQQAQQGQQPRPQGQQQAQGGNQQANQAQRPPGQGGGNNNRRRHRGGQNRNRNPNQQQGQGQAQGQPQAQHPGGINLERIYEKYLNLLDQHLIARRKYHDMFYRADNAQKNKLERNFYNTLHDIREFENKLAPEARELFEKRNNGLRPDNIYTTNHEITEVGEVPGPDAAPEDPHFLQSQKAADYSGDTEESMGNADDYLRYKNLL